MNRNTDDHKIHQIFCSTPINNEMLCSSDNRQSSILDNRQYYIANINRLPKIPEKKRNKLEYSLK